MAVAVQKSCEKVASDPAGQGFQVVFRFDDGPEGFEGCEVEKGLCDVGQREIAYPGGRNLNAFAIDPEDDVYSLAVSDDGVDLNGVALEREKGREAKCCRDKRADSLVCVTDAESERGLIVCNDVDVAR